MENEKEKTCLCKYIFIGAGLVIIYLLIEKAKK